MPGAGRAGDISGATQPGLSRQQCKGQRFLRLVRNPEIFVGEQLRVAQLRLEHGAQRGIGGAAAAQDYLKVCRPAAREPGKDHPAVSFANARDGKGGRSRNDIDLAQAAAPRMRQDLLHKSRPECFAAGSFWRWASQKRVSHHFSQEFRRYFPLSRQAAISVELFPAATELAYKCVEHHVSWTGIEGQHLVEPSPRRQERQVGDPADVLHNARAQRIRE